MCIGTHGTLTCGCDGTPRFYLPVHLAEVCIYFLLSVLCLMLHQNLQSQLQRNRKKNQPRVINSHKLFDSQRAVSGPENRKLAPTRRFPAGGVRGQRMWCLSMEQGRLFLLPSNSCKDLLPEPSIFLLSRCLAFLSYPAN